MNSIGAMSNLKRSEMMWNEQMNGRRIETQTSKFQNEDGNSNNITNEFLWRTYYTL